MKKASSEENDWLRPEYHRSDLGKIVRGKYAHRLSDHGPGEQGTKGNGPEKNLQALGSPAAPEMEHKINEDIESPVAREMERQLREAIDSPVAREMERLIMETMDNPVAREMQRQIMEAVDNPAIREMQRQIMEALDSPVAREMERQLREATQTSQLNDLTAQVRLTLDADLASLARTARQPWQYLAESPHELSLQMQSIVGSFESQQTFLEAQGAVFLLSQQYLEAVDWKALASLSAATELSTLEAATTDIARSYESFIQSVSSLDPHTLRPIVYDLPPLDIAGHADFLRTWVEPAERRFSSDYEMQLEPQLLIAELRHRVTSQLEPRLATLHGSLPKLWSGAREALRSSNPDRCRHAAVSTRELVTHLLHLLAPDEGVRQWTHDPEHYDEKRRPTRRARFLYICREVSTEDYASLVESIVTGTLAKLQLLQKGTHEIDTSLGERKIEALSLSVGADLLLLTESAIGKN